MIKSYRQNSYNKYLIQKNGDTNLNNYVIYFDHLLKNKFKYKYKINEISNKSYLMKLHDIKWNLFTNRNYKECSLECFAITGAMKG